MLLKKHNPNDPQWRGEEAMPYCKFGEAKKLHLANIHCFCRLLARLGKKKKNIRKRSGLIRLFCLQNIY